MLESYGVRQLIACRFQAAQFGRMSQDLQISDFAKMLRIPDDERLVGHQCGRSDPEVVFSRRLSPLAEILKNISRRPKHLVIEGIDGLKVNLPD